MIASRGSRHQAWSEVLSRLARADIEAIRETYAPDSYQHASVLSSIAVSIDDLQEFARARYRELAIFARRNYVPPCTVDALWSQAGLTSELTDSLLGTLVDRSLVQTDGRGWITLHDLQYEVVAYQLSVGPNGPAAAHRQLVEGYRKVCILTRATAEVSPQAWIDGPDDGYFFQNLAYHMVLAGLSDEVDHLLANFDWLRRTAEIAGISTLLASIALEGLSDDLGVVYDALRLSINALGADPLKGRI
jgi:APAF-1 helical domain